MVSYRIPWDGEKNIGASYNRELRNLGPEYDYVCFLDYDCTPMQSNFGKIVEDAIRANRQYDVYTCLTNRVMCKNQVTDYVDKHSNDIEYHKKIGRNHWLIYGSDVKDITYGGLISGMCMIVSRKAFELTGGFNEDGMLGVDNDFHKRCLENNIKIGLIQGLYCYHYYSGKVADGSRSVKHLLK